MMRLKTLSIGFSVLALISFMTVSPASAVSVLNGEIFLNPSGSTLNNCGGGTVCPGAYASVTVTLVDPTHVTVLFHALTQGSFSYLFGGAGPSGNIAGLVLTNTNVTGSLLTWTNVIGTNTLSFGGNAGSVDGVGSYNFGINASDNGSSHLVQDIGFTLTLNSGTWGCLTFTQGCGTSVINNTANSSTTWVNSKTGQTNFSSPSWAEAHLSVCTGSGATLSCGTITAWSGGAAISSQVPEPGTVTLLGTGLLLVGALSRRLNRFRK